MAVPPWQTVPPVSRLQAQSGSHDTEPNSRRQIPPRGRRAIFRAPPSPISEVAKGMIIAVSASSLSVKGMADVALPPYKGPFSFELATRDNGTARVKVTYQVKGQQAWGSARDQEAGRRQGTLRPQELLGRAQARLQRHPRPAPAGEEQGGHRHLAGRRGRSTAPRATPRRHPSRSSLLPWQTAPLVSPGPRLTTPRDHVMLMSLKGGVA